MADDPGKNTADAPRPDTADTAHTAGGGDSSGNPDAPQGAPVPVPWYRRPLFWGIVLFLLILALLGCLLLFLYARRTGSGKTGPGSHP